MISPLAKLSRTLRVPTHILNLYPIDSECHLTLVLLIITTVHSNPLDINWLQVTFLACFRMRNLLLCFIFDYSWVNKNKANRISHLAQHTMLHKMNYQKQQCTNFYFTVVKIDNQKILDLDRSPETACVQKAYHTNQKKRHF